jgi:serine/threonine-protein kinase
MLPPRLEDVRDAVKHRYTVESLVGSGGMGAVFRARHVSLDSLVAIKVLPIPASVGAEELARFRREAMLAAKLPHPNIVPVYEFEVRGDLAYLVMPLVEGTSLAHRLANEGPLSPRDARRLLEQVGSALAFAHERGIIHRDVKPANVLWEPENERWLITDFGIARHAQPSETDITVTGAVIGTPAYMAPEQAAGDELDQRADLYALAAMAFETLTGKRLDRFADREKAGAALRAAVPSLPPRYVDALTAPLALDPNERPPTVRVWLAMLGQSDSRPRWDRWLAGILGMATVAVGAGWLLLTSRQRAAAPAGTVVAVLPFTSSGGDSASARLGADVSRAFEQELRWIPGLKVVPATAVAAALGPASTGSPGFGLDSAAALLARQFAATEIVVGSVSRPAADRLALEASVLGRTGEPLRAAPEREATLDSLAPLVANLVVTLFLEGTPQAGRASPPALPAGGLAALRHLLDGDSLFRHAAYDEAIAQYERVLAFDSTYALAAFKRMLAEVMRAQPTRASDAVRSALEMTRRNRDRLDPTSRGMLEAYELLVVQGDLAGAQQQLSELTTQNRLDPDLWFVRGYFEFYFGSLIGVSPATAQFALSQADELNPRFAAVQGLLGWVALLKGEDDEARTRLRRYLSLDSASAWATLVRLVDSLRFRGDGAAAAATRTLDRRPTPTLELVALAGASLELRPSERAVAGLAARALQERASTETDRAVAFRLALGSALGAGRALGADSVWREARRSNVPRDELDHWRLVLAVTGLSSRPATGSDEREVSEAAARIAVDQEHPEGPWAAARWYQGRNAAAAAAARARLRAIATGGGRGLLARSLLEDLVAHDRLRAGDTTAAYALWRQATSRYWFEEVPFGRVTSLWPLRLAWAEAAAARGDYDEVIDATITVEHSPAFTDQVTRPVLGPLRVRALEATGDQLAARSLEALLAGALRDANGRWRSLADSLAARTDRR